MSNVLFDFDGTLFDTYEGISRCVNFALCGLGKAPLEEKTLRKFLGPPIFSSFKEFAGLEDELVEEAVQKGICGGRSLAVPPVRRIAATAERVEG